MLELNLNEIWNANDIVAPTHYNAVKSELQGKYKTSSGKIIQRYRNLFWLELLGNFLLFITIIYLVLRFGGIEKLLEQPLFKSLVDWAGNAIFTYAITTLLLFVYAFYHWIFYFKYFKDFNKAITATRGLDVYAALDVSIISIQKFRERTIRFGLILIIVGSTIQTAIEVLNGESIVLTLFTVVFAGVFGYVSLTAYYDYMHKPYQVDLESLKRQLEAE